MAMNFRTCPIITILAAWIPAIFASAHHGDDTALMLHAANISSPGGNYHLYYVVAEREVTIQEGDVLEYDIFLHGGNPSLKGGLDILCTDGTSLRDSGAVDAGGVRAHGDSLLEKARGAWQRRTISLAPLAGKTTNRIDVQFEGDERGDYVQFIDNIKITRSGPPPLIIYDNGQPPAARIDWRNGYSERAFCAPVDRERVTPGPALDAFVKNRMAKEELFRARESLRAEVELAKKFAKAGSREDLAPEFDKAISEAPDPDAFAGTAAEYNDILHQQRRHLEHAHPLMQQFSGRLVGHAHIDLQWLWEWPEGLDFSRSTFEQAAKFMEEFKDFTFTQSSAGLYEKIEEQYPALFETIQRRVREGRWEIAGGRWCEGDTNMISGESHARHMLYGQNYFKKAFGRISTVGWEPDTFGHTLQLPQILRLGGVDSYYFCRAGRNLPLFWWESPDGSRILAFDEPATGSWYNSDITDSNVQELLDFYGKTGLKDLIWVYGVGNHGGGPTREQVEKAVAWKDRQGRPAIKFSTAREFFDLCRSKDLEKLPVVKDELNPIFRGCYTTHSDIKRLNREAEAALVTAEALAFMASRSGYPYPSADLARHWKTVCWNHHHDTLPGSGIHESYELSHVQLNHVIEHAGWIQRSAARHIAHRVDDSGPGKGIIVLNPLGWSRDVEVAVGVSWNMSGAVTITGADGATWNGWIDGDTAGGQQTLLFTARAVPGFGFSTYRVTAGPESAAPASSAIAGTDGDVYILENTYIRATFSKETAHLTSLLDKTTNPNRQLLTGGRAGNRIEAHMERPHGMSAWEIGAIGSIETPGNAVRSRSYLKDQAGCIEFEFKYRASDLKLDITLSPGSRQINFVLHTRWNETGGSNKPAPMLRVAFPLGERAPGKPASGPGFESRYSVPFADIARRPDGLDVPALTWAWVRNESGSGAALLNTTKHAYSTTEDGELRLTLLRSSYEPDPAPDLGPHTIAYALTPVQPASAPAEITKLAFEWNHPAVALPVLHNTINSFAGDRSVAVLPPRWSFCNFDGLPHAVPTALKRAESGGSAVVRFYQDSPEVASGHVIVDGDIKESIPVNFLEERMGDSLQKVTPRPGRDPSQKRTQFPLTLRPFEIKTLLMIE